MLFKSASKSNELSDKLEKNPKKEDSLFVHVAGSTVIIELAPDVPIGTQLLTIDKSLRQSMGARWLNSMAEKSFINTGGAGSYKYNDAIQMAKDNGFSASIEKEVFTAWTKENAKSNAKEAAEVIGKQSYQILMHTRSYQAIKLLSENSHASTAFVNMLKKPTSIVHYSTDNIPTTAGAFGNPQNPMRTVFFGQGSKTAVGFVQAVSIFSPMAENASVIQNEETANRAVGLALINAIPALNELKKQTGNFPENAIISNKDFSILKEQCEKIKEAGAGLSKEEYSSMVSEYATRLGEQFTRAQQEPEARREKEAYQSPEM